MNPMQLLLIAAGGYLVYRYLQTPAIPGTAAGGTTGGTTGGTVSAGGGTATTGSGGGGGGGTATTGTTTTTTTGGQNTSDGTAGSGTATATAGDYATFTAMWGKSRDQLPNLPTQYDNGTSYVTAQGAAGNIAAMQILTEKGTVWDVDHWNFWRALTGANPVPSTVMDSLIVGDRAIPITVTEYRQRLTGVGISGLGRLGVQQWYFGHWY